MIHLYEATNILEMMSETVGHTKPWVVIANTPEGEKPFVVKLYTTAQINQNGTVENEVLGNVLAQQFDLKVPYFAFIHISEELVATKSIEIQNHFGLADIRPKFATIALDGIYTAKNDLTKKNFNKFIEIENLFAFDNLCESRVKSWSIALRQLLFYRRGVI